MNVRNVLSTVAVFTAAIPVLAGGADLDAAMAALRAGEYRTVVDLAAKVAADDPARAKFLYVAGEARLALEEWTEAETAFRAVLEAKGNALPAQVGLGRALQGAGRSDEALAVLGQAAERDKKDVAAQRALGEVLNARGETAKAVKVLRGAMKLAPEDALTGRALVEALLQGQEDGRNVDKDAAKEAERVGARLVKARKDHPMGHFLLGLVYDRTGKDRDAIAAYEAAIAADDHFLDAHKNLAILCTAKNPLYTDAERTTKAMEHYARYFELGGKDKELENVYRTLKGFMDSQGGQDK